MKRLTALVLFAGLSQAAPARAADLAPGVPTPTTPQVPTPFIDSNGHVVRTSASRVVTPVQDNVPPPVAAPAMPLPTGMPAPTGFAPVGASAGPDCGTCATSGGKRGACFDRFKQWMCFQPTTRNALPKLNPHPYVGPIAGTFGCTSTGGCGTAAGNCAAGSPCPTGGAGHGLRLPARGCNGGCVPPADDAIAGYRFAPVQSPAVAPGYLPQPAGYTTYKPAAAPAAKPAPQTAPAAAAPIQSPPSVVMPPRSTPATAAPVAKPVAPVDQASQPVRPAGYGTYTPVWSAPRPTPPLPKP